MNNFQKLLLYIIFIFGLLILSSSAAFAQESLQGMSLEELLNVQVVTASKTSESSADAPSSMTVFTHKEIETMGISSIDQLLDFVPGFQSTRDIEQGTANRVAARGRSTALSESVLFLINGQRLNDLYTGGVSIINRLIPVENIKQVEIIRGPGSALYGSNAFLGVINIITLDDVNSATFKLGTENEKEFAVNFAGGSDELKVSGFLKGFSNDGYEYENVTDAFGQTGNTTDPVKGIDAFLTVNYSSLTINARHMERTLNDFLTFGSLANYVNNESTKQSFVNALYKTEISDKFKLEFSTGYLTDKWNVQALLIPIGTEIAPGFSLDHNFIGGPYLESYNMNFNVDGFYKLSGSNELTAGVSYVNSGITEVKNVMTHNPVSLDFQGKATEFSEESNNFNQETDRSIFSFYAQDNQKFGDYLSLTVGVRYDNYNDFGSSFNPRGALIYTTPIDSKIKVMYGRAFRAPNFLELYDKNNPVDFGNKDLKAEKVQTIEVAYSQNISNLAATVTYFTNNISDQIILGAPTADASNPLGAPSFVNGSETTTSGIEGELKFAPLNNILISAAYTKLFDADLLLMSPSFGSVICNFILGDFNINVNGIFREKMALLPTQDSYVLVNSAITYHLTESVSAQIGARNIFDTEYKTVSSVFPQGVPNKGRTITAGLSLEY